MNAWKNTASRQKSRAAAACEAFFTTIFKWPNLILAAAQIALKRFRNRPLCDAHHAKNIQISSGDVTRLGTARSFKWGVGSPTARLRHHILKHHLGAKIMRQVRVPIGLLGLVALGLAVTATTAEAQDQGPCRQIRLE